jgi:ABC-type multidrug transport system ATPase subunit
MAVIFNQVEKRFGEILALSQVDFEVGEEELFGIIGPDGAGKSTLFRILVSLLLPDSGSCTVNGFDVKQNYREIRKIIGYMPGRFSLYMDLSVEENLSFYARVFGTTVDANYDLIRDIYSQIEPFRKRLAGKLSGGMKQKLALSCALIHRPRILVLDEPTTGVDAVSRLEFWEMLEKIRREGITILVSTPYMDEAARCDRIALFQRGRVLEIMDPSAPVQGDYPVYALRSDRGVYGYLEYLRTLQGVRSAWLFGDELHVTLTSNREEDGVWQGLREQGDESMEWSPVMSSIEDRFMELLQGAEVNPGISPEMQR